MQFILKMINVVFIILKSNKYEKEENFKEQKSKNNSRN